MPDLGPAVRTVIERCLGVKPGEEVVVVTDAGTESIGIALRDHAAEVAADAVLMVMDARGNDGEEPPATVASALLASDVFIAPTSKSISHTSARKAASDAGARGATMPGVTEDMLARVMDVDFAAMAARSRDIAELLSQAEVARLTCPRGTDFTLQLTRRTGIADDGALLAPGAFGNLPCGEGYIAPAGGEGTVVATSLAPLGLSQEPAALTVKEGRLAGAEGGLGPEFLERLRAHGELGCNLAELGIGTNDRAQLTGSMLEDEKILGTAHVAFGASADFGGTVSVPIHLDVVVLEPTLSVGDRLVLEAGRYALESQTA